MKKHGLVKILAICLYVCVGLLLVTSHLQAATPTYIQLEFSDIDYDEAQYIKFIIDADKDFDIWLYMKDNDNNSFYVIYQTENNEDTGDFDKDENDEFVIYLNDTEYVTGHDETFNSYEHSNSLSFGEYINTHWQKQEYNGGSAELEKIRIFGNEFKLYYIAIDDGDFSNPTWELDVSDGMDSLTDFKDDGHTYSSTTNISFQYDDCIYIYKNTKAAATEDSRAAAGYTYGYPWGYYAGYTGYGYPGSSYVPGYNPLASMPSWIGNMVASSNWNTSQMGIELSRPYYQSAIMSGWTPWQSTYRPQPFYGGYTGYGYPGGSYGPNIPTGIMNMMAHSAYSPADAYIPDLGYQLALPYIQSAVRSGWSPWSSPYGPQTYNSYGSYPWGY